MLAASSSSSRHAFCLNAIEKKKASLIKVFDQVEEKYPYYDFLKLHRTKEHGKAEEWQ
jgi:hypothetical protein